MGQRQKIGIGLSAVILSEQHTIKAERDGNRSCGCDPSSQLD
jgi:hypothetical protein